VDVLREQPTDVRRTPLRLILENVAVLVPKLGQQEAPQPEHAEGVPLGVLALLYPVTIHVANCLGEAHTKETPPLELARLPSQPVSTAVAQDFRPQALADQFVTLLSLGWPAQARTWLSTKIAVWLATLPQSSSSTCCLTCAQRSGS